MATPTWLKTPDNLSVVVVVVVCYSNDSSSKNEPVDVMPSISLISTFPQAPSTSDSVRIKCREMLSQALQAGGNWLYV